MFTEEMKDRLTDIYCEVLSDYDWEYTRRAVGKIVNKAIARKSSLIELLRNHPKWDEENLMVAFDQDVERETDFYGINIFRNHFSNWNAETFHMPGNFTTEDFQTFEKVESLAFKILYETSQFLTDEEIKEENQILKNIPQLSKMRFNHGQKRSKAVSKICKALGFSKFVDYERVYARYADAVNPIKITRHTCISVNPIDFLLSSNGNSWSSCHNINKEEYSGCNCSGGISYSLDDVTICMYTVDASYEENEIFLQPKINRMMIHVSTDLKHFVAARCYPAGCYNAGDSFREIFEKVLADCADIPNLWVKSNENLSKYAKVSYEATAYPDIEYVDSNHIVHCFHKSVEENKESVEEIVIGAAPICVECGCEHGEKDQINCCTPYERVRYCEVCGSEIDEDDEVFSEHHMQYGCRNCMSYCDFTNDWYYDEEIRWVADYNGYVNIYTLEESDEFFYCHECDEWHYIDAALPADTPEGIMCEDCAKNYGYQRCENCGVWYDEADMIENDFGDTYCEDCAESLGLIKKPESSETEVA